MSQEPIQYAYGTANGMYSMKFTGSFGTDRKRDVLYQYAENVLKTKNIISEIVNKNLEKYFWQPKESALCYGAISKYEFVKIFRQLIKSSDETFKYTIEIGDKEIEATLNSCFDHHTFIDIFKTYLEKISNVRQSIRFYLIEKLTPVYYKRETKDGKHKKGDFKHYEITTKSTPLSMTLTYLARYGNEFTIRYLERKIKSDDITRDLKTFFIQILNHIDKFGWDRLFDLALRKRNRIFSDKFAEPIHYESCTLKGRSRKTEIICKNENSSIIDAWVNLSGIPGYKTFSYPVKYSEKYYGKLDDYNNPNNNEFIIKFHPVTHKPTFILKKEGERKYVIIPQEVDEQKLAAFDVNIKHNLLMSHTGKAYNLPQKKKNELITVYMTEVYKTYELLKLNKHYYLGVKRRRKMNALTNKIVSMERDLIADICKEYAAEGYNHIALEDLEAKFGKCFVKKSLNAILNPDSDLSTEDIQELELEINNALVTKFLHIASIKNEFVHIAKNYGIAVSFVQAPYTSQRCPRCGYVHRDNRKTQEEFVCQECGYAANADKTAAINIKNRVAVTVLRESLLKLNPEDGTYRPKDSKKSKESVKKVLDSVRYTVRSGNLTENSG